MPFGNCQGISRQTGLLPFNESWRTFVSVGRAAAPCFSLMSFMQDGFPAQAAAHKGIDFARFGKSHLQKKHRATTFEGEKKTQGVLSSESNEGRPPGSASDPNARGSVRCFRTGRWSRRPRRLPWRRDVCLGAWAVCLLPLAEMFFFFFFPWVALKGIYHCWTYIYIYILYFFQGGSSKWKSVSVSVDFFVCLSFFLSVCLSVGLSVRR